MKFGINVNINADHEDYLQAVKEVGIDHYRVCIGLNTKIAQAKRIAKSLGESRCYLIIMQADSEEVFHDWDKKTEKMMKLVGAFKKKQILGVNLIHDVHRVLRRGQHRSGVPRNEIVSKLNILSKSISERGLTPVMHMRQDDIESGLWDSVNFDVIDVDYFVSKTSYPLPVNKRIWIGRAGSLGGERILGIQKTMVRKLNDIIGNRCELAFIWSSEKDSKRFRWTKNGKFILTAKQMEPYNRKKMP